MQGSHLQTNSSPLQTLDDVEGFIDFQASVTDWDHAAILTDIENTVILLCSSELDVVQALRICLESREDTIEALKQLNKLPRSKHIRTAVIESGIGDICDIGRLSLLNKESRFVQRDIRNAFQFYDFKEPRDSNRGTDISASTARQVVCDAHGYCMFEGCGKQLLHDPLTGVAGNFNYLAHIVASSPNGPRGNDYSHKLSDDPGNIMLLCDIHHRLVDKVAQSEYDRDKLDRMRQAHIEKSKVLLQGLSFQGVPNFVAFYNVGGWVPEPPTQQEVATSLQPLHSYHNGMTFPLLNWSCPKGMTDQEWLVLVPQQLEAAKSLYMGCQAQPYTRTGLYAVAPGAILVGLGNVVGNKNGLHAVPRSREYNSWCWARKSPLSEPFYIESLDKLAGEYDEVILSLTLTDTPKELFSVAELLSKTGLPLVSIKAREPGNNCLGHPEEGHYLRELVHQTLHHLRNSHKVKVVHLLPCAPNAALLETGRAIEHFHPKVRVYEHILSDGHKYMVPRIDLVPESDKVRLEGVPLEVVEKFHHHFKTVDVEGLV